MTEYMLSWAARCIGREDCKFRLKYKNFKTDARCCFEEVAVVNDICQWYDKRDDKYNNERIATGVKRGLELDREDLVKTMTSGIIFDNDDDKISDEALRRAGIEMCKKCESNDNCNGCPAKDVFIDNEMDFPVRKTTPLHAYNPKRVGKKVWRR
jgi:hypothetical protein